MRNAYVGKRRYNILLDYHYDRFTYRCVLNGIEDLSDKNTNVEKVDLQCTEIKTNIEHNNRYQMLDLINRSFSFHSINGEKIEQAAKV